MTEPAIELTDSHQVVNLLGEAMPLILAWAWRYHVLGHEEWPELGEALRAAGYGEDLEWLDCIECWTARGEHYIICRDLALVVAVDLMPATPPRAPAVAALTCVGPDGHESTEVYATLDEARQAYARLLPYLGDRVRLELLPGRQESDPLEK